MKRLGEFEIAREGRRVLRKLASDGAVLAQRQRGGYAVGATCVSTAVLHIFRDRGWVVPAAQRERSYIISEAGLYWLRRELAAEEPFAAQHQLREKRTITGDDGMERIVTVNEGESPLGWLYFRKDTTGRPLIDRVQYQAGERLRRDFTLAQMTPRLAADFSAPVLGGRRGPKTTGPLPEVVVAAKQRVTRALHAAGPGLGDLLLDVCCYLRGLEDVERAAVWPRHAGRVVLRIALDRLATHYGMRITARTSRRIRVWVAEEKPNSENNSA